jgi:hypothetical protein
MTPSVSARIDWALLQSPGRLLIHSSSTLMTLISRLLLSCSLSVPMSGHHDHCGKGRRLWIMTSVLSPLSTTVTQSEVIEIRLGNDAKHIFST